MPLIDLLPPEQRAALRGLRRRISNRENMRRYRGKHRYTRLCAGVDLPIEAGTCGRLVDRRFERCIRCFNRRRRLLEHALNPVELTTATLLESVEPRTAEAGVMAALFDVAEEATPPAADDGGAVPLLDDLSPLGDPCLRW